MTPQQLQTLRDLLFECQSMHTLGEFTADNSTGATPLLTQKLRAECHQAARKWAGYRDTLKQALAELEGEGKVAIDAQTRETLWRLWVEGRRGLIRELKPGDETT